METRPYAGAGGKIRRGPLHRSAAAATPYDRPPAAAAAHRLATAAAAVGPGYAGPGGEGDGGGWVSRLVDPASRLIAGGAARLFSTVFRKRLAPAPAPTQPPLSAPPEGSDGDLPLSTHTSSTPILEGGMEKGKSAAGTSGNKALSEVEHLLMRKTFTRVEFDRLTDLLRARTVESDLSGQVDHREDNNEARTGIDGAGGSTSHWMAVDHTKTANVPISDVSSPADLAKQYMSSRYTREPQSSSLRSRVFLDNKAEGSNIAYDRKSGTSLVQELNKFGNENPGLPVNGYVTSGIRGRSAIHRMSRSPFFKVPSSSSDMNVSPFSSSQARAQSLAAGSRQVLKRRGADFENELGSIGPIRRIRQKSNMMSPFRDARASPRGNLLPNRTIGSNFTEGSSPLQESPSSKRLLLGAGQSVRPGEAHRNSEGGKSPNENTSPVPSQSNKTADKIFERLNVIAPSPKEKQSGEQSVSENRSPSMSKRPVWEDDGPGSVNDPSSSLKVHDLDRVSRAHVSGLNGSPMNKDKLAKHGSSNFPSGMFQAANKDIKSDHVAVSDKPSILGNSFSAAISQKPGFKMAVFEDLEFDDDQEASVPSKNSSIETGVRAVEQKFGSEIKEQKVQPDIFEQKVETNASKEKVGSSPVREQPLSSPSKDVSSPSLFSFNDPEKKATPLVSADKNGGFAFPLVPPGASSKSIGSAVPRASSNDNKLTDSPFMFGGKQSNKSDLETSTAGVKMEAKLVESVTKPATLGSNNLERGNDREKAGDIQKSNDKPSAASTLTAPVDFASAASTSPGLSNGLSHSSSSKLSNITSIDKPAAGSAPHATITTFAVSSSSPPMSSSSSPAFTTFNFGSGSSVVAAGKSDNTVTEKSANTLSFGTLGTASEPKPTAPDPASKTSSDPSTAPIMSNTVTASSSPVSSSSTFSSTPTFLFSQVASSSNGTVSSNSAPSTTLSTASGVQPASTTTFAFSSPGSSIFGFSSAAKSTGLSTSVDGSTSQPSASSALFSSKLPQPEGTVSQPSQSSEPQFSSPFPTTSFAAVASSSGSGAVSFGVGTSSTGTGTVQFGAKASSSGLGTFSFGAGSGPGTVSFGVGASSSGPGTVSFGASSSGPGTVSFGASSSGPGTASASSSGLGTVSFGVTTSQPGSGFGNPPFGPGAAFSGAGTGFAFSAPSSSAGPSSAVASTSMFGSSSAASSTPVFGSNPFASSSSPASTFTFGQSASSGGGFSFGAQSAPTFSSQAPVFSFSSPNTSTSSTPQPAFGMTNANTAFGMGSPGNDQMSMEDSMTDDTNQAAPTEVPAPVFGSSPFGQPGSSPAAPVFGAPVTQPAGVFQFGNQQGSMQQNPSFPPGGSLEFQGGNFSLGSTGGGGDKANRRIVKVKRGQKKR